MGRFYTSKMIWFYSYIMYTISTTYNLQLPYVDALRFVAVSEASSLIKQAILSKRSCDSERLSVIAAVPCRKPVAKNLFWRPVFVCGVRLVRKIPSFYVIPDSRSFQRKQGRSSVRQTTRWLRKPIPENLFWRPVFV